MELVKEVTEISHGGNIETLKPMFVEVQHQLLDLRKILSLYPTKNNPAIGYELTSGKTFETGNFSSCDNRDKEFARIKGIMKKHGILLE